MLSYHRSRLRVYCHMIFLQICLDERRKLIIALFLALEHHSNSLCLAHNLLSAVDSAIFVGYNEHRRCQRLLKIAFQSIERLQPLRLLHDYYAMRSRHNGVSFCHVYHLRCRSVCAEHNGLIKVAVVGFEHIVCYVIGYSVDIVRLVAHKHVHWSVFLSFEVAHNGLECDR